MSADRVKAVRLTRSLLVAGGSGRGGHPVSTPPGFVVRAEMNIGHSCNHYKQCRQHFNHVPRLDATRAHGTAPYRNFSTLPGCTWQWARDWSRTWATRTRMHMHTIEARSPAAFRRYADVAGRPTRARVGKTKPPVHATSRTRSPTPASISTKCATSLCADLDEVGCSTR